MHLEESPSLRVLLIEDNVLDAKLLQKSLRNPLIPVCNIDWVRNLKSGLESLRANTYDVILVDLYLPDSHSISTLKSVQSEAGSSAILVLTGVDDRQAALETLRTGAQDYLVKGKPSGESVYRAMLYAIERKNRKDSMNRLALIEQRQEFITMLAHDLRSPISAQQQFLSMMLKQFDCISRDEFKQLLGEMQQQSSQMLQMIGNVLDNYRYDSNALNIQCTPVGLMTLLRNCLTEVHQTAEAKNIKLEFSGVGLRPVQADRLALRRVISNLLGNALKFTEDGGTIRLEFFEKNGQTVVRVSDTGVGIKPENLEKIFDKFWQEQKGYRSNGLGLGLYICKQILEAQGATISCRSEVGRGTTFEITLRQANSPAFNQVLTSPRPRQYLNNREDAPIYYACKSGTG